MKYTNELLGLFGVKEEEKPTPKKKPVAKKNCSQEKTSKENCAKKKQPQRSR